MSVPTLLVTGAPGAGKTTVANEVAELLRPARVPHGVIDLDELGRVSPSQEHVRDPASAFGEELVQANLAAVWSNYRNHGVEPGAGAHRRVPVTSTGTGGRFRDAS